MKIQNHSYAELWRGPVARIFLHNCVFVIYILDQRALTQSTPLGSFSFRALTRLILSARIFAKRKTRGQRALLHNERAHKAHARHRGPPALSACAFSTRSIWYAANNHSPYLVFQNRYSKMSCRCWAGGPRAKDNSTRS